MWVKHGEFSDKSFNGTGIFGSVEYINSDNQKQRLELIDYGCSISIWIEASKEILKALEKKLLQENIPTEYEKLTGFFRSIFETSEFQLVFKFLKIVESFLPIASIKKEILETLNIKSISDEKEFYSNLSQLIVDGKLDEARQEVNQIEFDDNIVFKFANLLKDNGYYNEALDLYQDIVKDNPNYKQANKEAENILLIYSNHIDLTPEEQIKNLENKIQFMLNAELPEDQRLLDCRFAELSGDSLYMNTVKDVKTNADTLFNLARVIKGLKQENFRLQQEVQRLSSNDNGKDNKITSIQTKTSVTSRKRASDFTKEEPETKRKSRPWRVPMSLRFNK